LVHHSKGITQTGFFDDKKGAYTHCQEYHNKIDGHKDHKYLKGKVCFKGGCPEKGLPLEIKKVLKHKGWSKLYAELVSQI
jgi:hypothetical protein